MTASRLIDPSFRALDSLGNPISGACLYVYEAGTSTPINTYSENTLTSANANPVESGATGLFPDMFVAADDYKVIFTDGSGTSVITDVVIDTWDNINISSASSFSSGINPAGYSEHLVNTQTGTTYTYLTGDRAKKVVHSNISAIASSLPAANSTTFADGWYFTAINEGAGLLTITPTTSTIGGETTLVLTRGMSATITSDGTNYSCEVYGEPVGSRKTWYSATAPQGWLIENGDSIGSASSGATKAAAKYRALYAHLYGAISDTYAPVATGRGASANADFDANKALTMPTMANKSEYGVGTAAAGETAGAATVASTGTVGTSGAGTAPLPAHTHFTVASIVTTEVHTNSVEVTASEQVASTNYNGGGGSANYTLEGTGTAASLGLTSSSGSGGTHDHPGGTYTGNATSVLHPVRGTYWIIKY